MMKKIEFPGHNGQMLSARLDEPEGEPVAYALFAHCFTCTKDIFAAGRIAKTLAAQGYAVLRFDFTGLGASEGDFANTNFSSNIMDLIAAADWMRENLPQPAKLLIGHSLGGAASLAAAAEIPDLSAVVTIAAPSRAKHVEHHFSDYEDEIINEGEAEVCLVGRPFRIQKHFLEDIRNHKMEEAVKGLKQALLVMHAPLDETVGIENAGDIFSMAKHPKSFVSLDGADHLISRREDADYVAEIIAAWAKRWVTD